MQPGPVTQPLRRIEPEDLLLLNAYEKTHPVRIDLVYAQPAHPDNMFKAAIYRPDARMWGHREFVPIILRASEICHARTGLVFELKDCLRTTEAQALICESAIVRAHPAWLEEPRLFSPPGKGGHPRGMAVDIVLIDQNGDEIDMGTPFDYMTGDKKINPAARDYTDFGKGAAYNREVLENRRLLENCMLEAAKELGHEVLPLPQEWWDFRFPNPYSGLFEPISDRDLPAHMRMTKVNLSLTY